MLPELWSQFLHWTTIWSFVSYLTPLPQFPHLFDGDNNLLLAFPELNEWIYCSFTKSKIVRIVSGTQVISTYDFLLCCKWGKAAKGEVTQVVTQ